MGTVELPCSHFNLIRAPPNLYLLIDQLTISFSNILFQLFDSTCFFLKKLSYLLNKLAIKFFHTVLSNI